MMYIILYINKLYSHHYEEMSTHEVAPGGYY